MRFFSLFLLLALASFLLALLSHLSLESLSPASEDPEPSYVVSFYSFGGLIVCSSYEEQVCGLKLSDCSTHLEYRCVNSVTFIDRSLLSEPIGPEDVPQEDSESF